MENPFNDKPVRPTFITVLCILTFIGSGWKAVSNLISIFTYNLGNTMLQIEQISDATNNQYGNNAFLNGIFNSSVEVLKITAEYGREIAIMSLVLSLLSIVGAILMFNLRRSGFYFYVAAQSLLLFIVPYFTGFSLLIFTGILFSSIPTLIFIILYAVNLKHMH